MAPCQGTVPHEMQRKLSKGVLCIATDNDMSLGRPNPAANGQCRYKGDLLPLELAFWPLCYVSTAHTWARTSGKQGCSWTNLAAPCFHLEQSQGQSKVSPMMRFLSLSSLEFLGKGVPKEFSRHVLNLNQLDTPLFAWCEL